MRSVFHTMVPLLFGLKGVEMVRPNCHDDLHLRYALRVGEREAGDLRAEDDRCRSWYLAIAGYIEGRMLNRKSFMCETSFNFFGGVSMSSDETSNRPRYVEASSGIAFATATKPFLACMPSGAPYRFTHRGFDAVYLTPPKKLPVVSTFSVRTTCL